MKNLLFLIFMCLTQIKAVIKSNSLFHITEEQIWRLTSSLSITAVRCKWLHFLEKSVHYRCENQAEKKWVFFFLFLRGDMKKMSFSNHEFFSEHWIKQRERVGGPPGTWGGWLQSSPNQRVPCATLGEADEREEGEFAEHRSPLLSPFRPAALPRSAHVSPGSNTGPTAALQGNADSPAPTHSDNTGPDGAHLLDLCDSTRKCL